MLMIQAIRYLSDQLEENLKVRNNSQAPSDTILAEKLKAHNPNAALIIAKPVDHPTDLEEETLRALAGLHLTDEQPQGKFVGKGFSLEMLALPPCAILKTPNSQLTRQKSDLINQTRDSTELHFGMTWGDFISLPCEEFKAKLKTSLIKEDLTQNKMTILARFRRQLILLSAYATQVLLEREKVINLAEGKFAFKDSIDEWLVARVTDCASEAQSLCAQVLEDNKIRVKSLTIEKGPGETEGMLKVCEQVVKEFYDFCNKANEKDRINSPDQRSMLDLMPNKTKLHQARRMLNEKAAKDLVVRLFKIATSQHYPEKAWYFSSWNPAGFSVDKAKVKCVELARALHDFEEAVSKCKDDSQEYWDLLLDKTHYEQAQANLHKPMFSASKQNAVKLWEEVHDGLVQMVPFCAEVAKTKHSHCEFK